MQRSEQQVNDEYIFAISQLKRLGEEYHAAVPTDIKQRIKEGIKYAASQLEMMGVPRRKIIGKLYEDLGGDQDSFYKLRNIYYILDSPEYQDTDENANLQKDLALNILPENEEYDSMLADYQSVITSLRGKMDKPFASLMDKKDLQHTLATGKGMALMALNCLDERQITHVPLINLFINCAIDYTLADAYSHYYIYVKDLIKRMTAKDKIRGIRTMEAMSSKQSHETVYLRIKEIHYSLEPTDEHEARAKGFSGEKCPECSSWRTDRVPDSTSTGKFYFCIHCDHQFEKQFIKPYEKPGSVRLDGAGNTLTVIKANATGVSTFD